MTNPLALFITYPGKVLCNKKEKRKKKKTVKLFKEQELKLQKYKLMFLTKKGCEEQDFSKSRC